MDKHKTPNTKEIKRYLGIDIGGSNIKWGIVRHDGHMILHGTESTESEQGAANFYRTVAGIIENAKQKEVLSGIGICTAGIVDSQKGVVLGGIQNIPFLLNYPLREVFEAEANLPVRVINDVNAVAIGEQWIGDSPNNKTIFCITIGTGIGGSLLIDGKIFEGAHYRSCEIGEIDYGEEQGSFETAYSARALLIQARERLKTPNLTSNELFEKVAQKDVDVMPLYNKWIDGLARKIADIILLIDPEKLLIGGGITERGELLLNPLEKAIRIRLPTHFRDATQIELASCGNNAGVLGAVKNLINCTQKSS